MDPNSNKYYTASYVKLPSQKEFTEEAENEYKDRYFLVRVLTFLFGTVSLMPYNFMVTANNYWMHILKDDSLNSTDLTKKNVWQQYFSTGITIAEAASFIISGSLMLLVGRKLNLNSRLYSALTVVMICLILNLITVCMKLQKWQNVSFYTALLLAFLTNSTCCIFQVSSMAFVSKFPEKYLTYFLYGQGYSGVIISTISLITIAIGNDPEQSVIIYFSVGIILLAVTIFLLWRSQNALIYVYYMDHQEEKTKCKETNLFELLRIFKNIWPCILIFEIMLTTIMPLHPGLTALVVSDSYGHGNLWNDKYFIPVVTFLFGDICGVIGRSFSSPFIKKSNVSWVIFLMMVRLILFIFLVLYCNILPRKNLPVYFGHDWEYIIIVGSLTFSNGVVHNACVLSLESMESDNKEMAFTLFSSATNIFSVFFYPLGPILVSVL